MNLIWGSTHKRQFPYIDGLVQERHNSIAHALELRLSCTNPSISPPVVGLWSVSVVHCIIMGEDPIRGIRFKIGQYFSNTVHNVYDIVHLQLKLIANMSPVYAVLRGHFMIIHIHEDPIHPSSILISASKFAWPVIQDESKWNYTCSFGSISFEIIHAALEVSPSM